jgi:tripartite-type tricarboxylate transporter receptor subunit TctC
MGRSSHVRILSFAASLALSIALTGQAANAQGFPSRPVTIVVPSSAGGPADVAARLIAERFSQALGQQVVIDTAPGAGGTIGMGRVARAAPDGYTLLIHQNGFAIAPALYAKLTFDTEKDFVTVGLVNRGYSVLLGRKSLEADRFADLKTWMTGPGRPARVGHPGPGTFGHLQITLAVRQFAPDASMIAYRGIAPAVNDLLGGHIDIAQVSAAVATPHVRAGSLKAYATTSPTRIPQIPEVPSWGEVLDKDLERPLWHALFAPAGTPRPILERLNAALRETLADERVRQNFANTTVEAFPQEMLSLEAAHAFIRDELKYWGNAVRDNDVKAN